MTGQSSTRNPVFHAQAGAGRRRGNWPAWALASLAAGAAACCVSACSSGTAAGTASGPAAQGQATAARAPQSAATVATPVTQGSAAAVDRTSPGAVLADWMHQVVRGDYTAACQDMRQPGLSASRSQTECVSSQGRVALNALHANFTTDGIRPATPISAVAHVTGTSATVGGGDVNVAGKTLNSLIIAHSTGVNGKNFDIGFDLTRMDGKWYVTNMNMNV
jgi:hypothetical protein